jgi:hypothetical protein
MRVLEFGGQIYIEVPAPDTDGQHARNPNHYSVFGKQAWACLITKAGFLIDDITDIGIETNFGKDIYFSFMAHKESDPALWV